MKKVAIFMGTRPEGIKMAPVVKEIEAVDGLEPIVVSTGQHKEMLQQVGLAVNRFWPGFVV